MREEALKLGTRDSLLDYHVGMIRQALGDQDGAREALKRAIARNSQFSQTHAEAARQALEGLDRP